MRKLLNNNHGDLNMILTAIILAITLAVGILIVYNVMIAVDMSSVDDDLATDLGYTSGTDAHNATTYAVNATNDLISNVNTFYTVAPIALIVIAAVGILSYVLLLRRERG